MTEHDIASADQQTKPAGRRHGLSRELPFLILIALVLALLIKTFLVQAFYIPSGSMENTLHIGDRVLVNKLVYRIRDVHRGEIIVFRGPTSWQDNPEFTATEPSNPISRFFTWLYDPIIRLALRWKWTALVLNFAVVPLTVPLLFLIGSELDQITGGEARSESAVAQHLRAARSAVDLLHRQADVRHRARGHRERGAARGDRARRSDSAASAARGRVRSASAPASDAAR